MVGSHESAFLPLCKTHISGFLGKHVYRSFSQTTMGGSHESAFLPFWENHIQSRFQRETAVESTGYSKQSTSSVNAVSLLKKIGKREREKQRQQHCRALFVLS